MSDRWKMNRIGFVNFWLYDEEDFSFEDGKLLLRGQNGSGKSITTQSFIPFVLDGDRTPSRLDPFGSSDRRMEYYFLGEEGREEATGYLFLEFKKGDAEEYRTIGVGQKAKRGKPMDFWGFVILDGRRIGVDLWLYKTVGSSKIPCDKREMKAALGEENYFTDSQSEYKKHVNQYLFGFRKEEQYEQFIKLLVKVRAPKLSKEFKPTKVYDILNDSLQTLTDEDLRAMVEAMEKMDEIQDSLEMLNRAFDDVKIIRNEYMRYNQYMLAKKAEAYLQKKREVDQLQRQQDEQTAKMQETEQNCQKKEKRLEELERQKRLSETERDGLLDLDLEGIDRRLEMVRREREEAAQGEKRWEEKIREYQERIWRGEREIKAVRERLEQKQQELVEAKGELEEQQEVLQWDEHQKAVRSMEADSKGQIEEVGRSLTALKRLLDECRKTIQQYEQLARQYDDIAEELEHQKREKLECEQQLEAAQDAVLEHIDSWITTLFAKRSGSGEWHPDQKVLKEVEEKARAYQSTADAGPIQELLRSDYEQQRQRLLDVQGGLQSEYHAGGEALGKMRAELEAVRNQKELEPERDKATERSRDILREMGIEAVPFYRTVEFSDELDPAACARLEAQIQKMGMADALVVSQSDFARIRQDCPEFTDAILYMEETGNSGFDRLRVNEELSSELQKATSRILGNLYEEENGAGIYLGTNGWFRQGVLYGRSEKAGEAELIGTLARRRQKEQKIAELEQKITTAEQAQTDLEQRLQQICGRLATLQEEYRQLPDFSELNAALAKEREYTLLLQVVSAEQEKVEKREQEQRYRKNQEYQNMLQKCRAFPYGRTQAAYDEGAEALEEYHRIWQEIRQILLQLEIETNKSLAEEDALEKNEQQLDDAFLEKRGYEQKRKEAEIQICQMEEYLQRPDIREMADRLKQLREELRTLAGEISDLKNEVAVLKDRCVRWKEEAPEKLAILQSEKRTEGVLEAYFEEELSLKLVMEQNGRSLSSCAEEAEAMMRDTDRNREAAELFQSLFRVYQQHNGSLTNYGTSIESCFGTDEGQAEEQQGALHTRVRIVSVWNGKKVYLEELYRILKATIEETELLIQKKDRELFEDILSQTISQQLTDRIAESRKWVEDMSALMKAMDTSMGLNFSLDWKPCKAENEAELDTAELEEILLRDRVLLTMEDIEKVAEHFRNKIRAEKMRLEEANTTVNYMDLVRDALDYRKWFEFHMFYRRGGETRKLLTNAAFNRFSGGEKAMAMYVPLFAAVNAQYKKAEQKDHPRMIALDEAFAGVDDKNISSMFALVHKLDFDYIMNSQALWGCFDTVRGLRIAELLRPQNSKVVSVIRYTWNGRERILDEQ